MKVGMDVNTPHSIPVASLLKINYSKKSENPSAEKNSIYSCQQTRFTFDHYSNCKFLLSNSNYLR